MTEQDLSYFNPFRKTHVDLMKVITDDLLATKAKKVAFVKFGDRTQHVFKDGEYFMTINWEIL